MNEASLLDREETDDGVVFHMHHLVREFVIYDTKIDEGRYRLAMMQAVCGIHELISAHLLEEGNSLYDPAEFWVKILHLDDVTQENTVKLLQHFATRRYFLLKFLGSSN